MLAVGRGVDGEAQSQDIEKINVVVDDPTGAQASVGEDRRGGR
jgi:hypothetical protein